MGCGSSTPTPTYTGLQPEEQSYNDESSGSEDSTAHLHEEFNSIDQLLSLMKNDPMLKSGDVELSAVSNFVFTHSIKDREKIGDYFSKTVGAIKTSYEKLLASFGLTCYAAMDESVLEGNLEKLRQNLRLVKLRAIVSENTDASYKFSEAVCKTGLLKHIVDDLKVVKVEHSTTDNQNSEITFLVSLLILQNCSKNADVRSTMRKYKTIKYLLPFLHCQDEVGRLRVLITLANLMDETEDDVILASTGIFDPLFDILKQTWDDYDYEHRYLGIRVEDLVDALLTLAEVDANMSYIVKKGAVPILIKVMNRGYYLEMESAVICIHTLTFNEGNCHIFKENDELIKALEKHKTSTERRVFLAANGALLRMRSSE